MQQTRLLPHPENLRQWSIKHFLHCVMKQPAGYAMTLTHNRTIGCIATDKWVLQRCYYVLKMSVNGASMTFGHASWTIQGLCGDVVP
jgi:hypothetical protein